MGRRNNGYRNSIYNSYQFWIGSREKETHPIGGVIARPLFSRGDRLSWVRLINEKNGRRICSNENREIIEMRNKENLVMVG